MTDNLIPSSTDTPAQTGPTPIEGEDDISLLDLALVLAENLRLLILVPLAAGVVALGIAYLTTPIFTATTRILPPQQQQGASALLAGQFGALAGLAGAAGIKNPADQYVALLKSGPVLDAMIERFKLKQLWDVKFTVDARQRLDSLTKVTASARDGIISIEVDDPDPKRAAEIANAYVEELRNLLKTLAVTEAAQRRLFFEGQLKQAKDNLTKSEIALRGSGISEANLKTVPQSALEALARIRAQITAQEIRLASMRTSMTDLNPAFKVALQELAALRAELSKAEQSNSSKAGGDGADYIAKFRDFKYYETLFDLMAKQYEVARLDEAREGAVIQVLDPAQPPERKSKPAKARSAVLTTLVTFFIMLVVVFIRQALRNMANQPKFAEKFGRLRRLLLLRGA
ncbi:MAG: lipopolysaccharide biosynthesis protein [Acidobacteria bacterium]|nr:lipopolysaccharide biosynthesis protein [Acidobacteriota bacterium]